MGQSSATDRWGLDEHGRYYLDADGEHLMIEPWPYWRPLSVRLLVNHVVARWYVLCWFWGTRHQRHLWRH